jgi:hypothetical protein
MSNQDEAQRFEPCMTCGQPASAETPLCLTKGGFRFCVDAKACEKRVRERRGIHPSMPLDLERPGFFETVLGFKLF